MPLFEMQESEYADSDFTDYTLQVVQNLYGPTFKDRLLLPGPVRIRGVTHASRVLVRAEKLYRQARDTMGRSFRYLRGVSQGKKELPARQTRQGA